MTLLSQSSKSFTLQPTELGSSQTLLSTLHHGEWTGFCTVLDLPGLWEDIEHLLLMVLLNLFTLLCLSKCSLWVPHSNFYGSSDSKLLLQVPCGPEMRAQNFCSWNTIVVGRPGIILSQVFPVFETKGRYLLWSGSAKSPLSSVSSYSTC